MGETKMDQEYPVITIVMTVYYPEGKQGNIRRMASRSTLKSWKKHLKYSRPIDLIIVHDGANDSNPNIQKIHEQASEIWTDNIITISPIGRRGVGRSLNVGFAEAFKSTDVVLYAVDDWSLTEDFDITPWVQLLVEREDVGMVRLGPPHPNTHGVVEVFTDNWQGWGLRLDRYAYAFGHRPALYHRRLFDAYGWFAEGCSALECERLYAEKFVNTEGPDIVLALPHPWKHIDSIELAYLNPAENR